MEKYKKHVGDCYHVCTGICTYGKYQNYMCPYSNLERCPDYIPLTKSMIESWETKGYIRLNLNDKTYSKLRLY
jgi:hypothetical protein